MDNGDASFNTSLNRDFNDSINRNPNGLQHFNGNPYMNAQNYENSMENFAKSLHFFLKI